MTAGNQTYSSARRTNGDVRRPRRAARPLGEITPPPALMSPNATPFSANITIADLPSTCRSVMDLLQFVS
jgi:hypothetical protein